MKKRATKEAAISRSSKKKASGFTDHIRQTPSPINDPRKVEHFMSDDGQRMTRVDYGPLSDPILVSADQLMACGRLFPASLVERNPWHFLGPWLETPKGDFATFWACYKSETAEKERRSAVIGTKSCNRTNERNLLHAVHEYKALSLQKNGFELGKDEPPSILANAGLRHARRGFTTCMNPALAGRKKARDGWRCFGRNRIHGRQQSFLLRRSWISTLESVAEHGIPPCWLPRGLVTSGDDFGC